MKLVMQNIEIQWNLIMPWHDENRILYIGIEDFLLDPKSLEK